MVTGARLRACVAVERSRVITPVATEAARPRRVLACRPALALTLAVAVHFFALVVEQHHGGREWMSMPFAFAAS